MDSVVEKRSYLNEEIYFYEHTKLRRRQIDTVKNWPYQECVINREYFDDPSLGSVEVPTKQFKKQFKKIKRWIQKLPLINIKNRPKDAKAHIVYIWGAFCLTGKFILDIDNPFALTGYNERALLLYRLLIKRILLSGRCVTIRCMSEACKQSMKQYFGVSVFEKCELSYPKIDIPQCHKPRTSTETINFIFVSNQFIIKGGIELVNAFIKLSEELPQARLSIITNLPDDYYSLVNSCNAIKYYEAFLNREEVNEIMRNSDVLVHPTYFDSFGMVIQEALGSGLAIISTDIFAIKEMVWHNRNGILLNPPISSWKGFSPGKLFGHENVVGEIMKTPRANFQNELYEAMKELANDMEKLNDYKYKSLEIYSMMKNNESPLY